MRTIKFRAFDDGKMIYENDILHIRNEDNLVLRLARFWSNIRNDCQIMQFTGLLDKNGKEIYEGDILNWDYCGAVEWEGWMKDPIYKVEYENDYQVCAKGISQKLYLHAFRFKHTEVVGNIHENPELLNP